MGRRGEGLEGGRAVIANRERGVEMRPPQIPPAAPLLQASFLLLGFVAGFAATESRGLPLFLAVVLASRVTLGDASLFVGAASLLGLTVSMNASVQAVAALLALYPLWGLARRLPLPLDARLFGVMALTSAGAMFPWRDPLAAAVGMAAAMALAMLLRLVGHWGRSVSPILQDGALAVLYLLGTAGLTGLEWRGAPAALAVAALGSLWAVFRRSDGVLAPVFFGVLLALLGSAGPVAVGALIAGGAVAWVLRPYGRSAMGFGFLFGWALMSAVAGLSLRLVPEGAMVLSGILPFVLLPERIWRRPPLPLRIREVWSPEERLLQVSLALKEMAAALSDPEPPRRPPSTLRSTGLIETQVCTGCVHHTTCWATRRSHTQLGFQRAFAAHDAAVSFSVGEIPEEIRLRCPRKREVALASTLLLELRSLEEAAETRAGEVSRLLGTEMRRAAGLVDLALAPEVEEEVDGGTLAFEVGLAQIPKGGRGLSGDGVVIREIPRSRLLVALSDGMGVGVGAYREANLALDLVERLLILGVPTPELLDMVNGLLVLRSRTDAFATLDMAVVDLRGGEAEIVKVGAVPSFLIREGQIERLEARTAPVGILDRASIQSFSREVGPGDVMVVVSDGLTGSGVAWIEGALRSLKRTTPQELADGLMERALTLSGGQATDDMTALVATILPEAPENRENVRARTRRSLWRSRIARLPTGEAGSGEGGLPDDDA